MIIAVKIIIWVIAAGAAASLASYFLVVRERGWSGSTEGSSVCVCGRPLKAYELLPIVSWLLLGGRSSCCKARLPLMYLVVETVTSAMGVFGVYHHILWYLLPLVYIGILAIPSSLLKMSLPEGAPLYSPPASTSPSKSSNDLFLDDED